MGEPVVHFEIVSKDADRARSFYSDLFGWKAEPLGFENPTDYRTIAREDNMTPDGVGIGGGIGSAPEGYDGHVTFYIAVPDVEEALAKAESLGARRMMGPDQVPGGPEIGLFLDLDGNTVGVVKP